MIQIKAGLRYRCETAAMVIAPSTAPDLIAERLRTDQLRIVYPLIRQARPEVDLQRWIRFARRLARPGNASRSGIVAVRYAGQRFPCGLFCYRREHDLRHGLVLTAEHLVALGVLDPAPVLAALVRELEAIGAQLGCSAVRVSVPSVPEAKALRQCMAGQDDATTFAKSLPC